MTPSPTVPVVITWLTPEQGGRKQPPAGPIYWANTHMPGMTQGEGWSIVLIELVSVAEYHSTARLGFLVEEAPHHYFQIGIEVPIMEGPRVVGYAKVVENDKDL